MAHSHDNTQTWRQAFQSDTTAFERGTHCPAQDQIWAAVTEQLPVRQRRTMVAHMAECGACAESWRIAVSVAEALEHSRQQEKPAPAQRFLRWFPALPSWAAAGAGFAALTLAVMWWQSAPPPVPVMNGQELMRGVGDQPELRSELTEPVLSLAQPELRWYLEDGEADSYRLRVFVDDVDLLLEVAGLTHPEYRFEREELSELEVGQTLFWQVTAQLSDNREVHSPAYPLTVRP